MVAISEVEVREDEIGPLCRQRCRGFHRSVHADPDPLTVQGHEFFEGRGVDGHRQVRYSFLGEHLHDSDEFLEGGVAEQGDGAGQGCIRHGGNHAIRVVIPREEVGRWNDRRGDGDWVQKVSTGAGGRPRFGRHQDSVVVPMATGRLWCRRQARCLEPER